MERKQEVTSTVVQSVPVIPACVGRDSLIWWLSDCFSAPTWTHLLVTAHQDQVPNTV